MSDQPAGGAAAVPVPAAGACVDAAVDGAPVADAASDPAVDAGVDPVADGVGDGVGELEVADEVVPGAEDAVVGGAVVVSVTVVRLDDDGASSDPVPRLPPSTEKPLSPPEIGAPLTASTTVTAPSAAAKTAAEATSPSTTQRSRPGRDHQRRRRDVEPPVAPAGGCGRVGAARSISTRLVTAVNSTVSAASAGEPAPTRT